MLQRATLPNLPTSQPLTSGLVVDPATYSGLARAARDNSPEGLDAAARAFESLLLGQMVKQMRSSTSLGGGLFDSAQTQLYQDLYDQQLTSALSNGPGLGLGVRTALLRQLDPNGTARQQNSVDPATLPVPERNRLLQPLRRTAPADTAAADANSPEALFAQLPPLSIQGRWPPRNAEEFVAYLQPYAKQAADVLNMDTTVLLAQSALETGWGRHIPRHADGRSSFNLFGIKADRRWNGDSVGVGTLEYRNGIAQREQARFRAYSNPAESFVDYVAFLKRNPRYGNALESRTAEDFIRGLQHAGYATDPRYANKVLGLRERILAFGALIAPDSAPKPAPNAIPETQVSTAPADTPVSG
ncbi:flagellar protein FlgJ [Allochromatium warmingii]|uniref:Peptidoglycan hydrolase FlgJ n=1 Tax=Allochromatium warmingii TaxID=61595 RepID=A0A1H3CNK7_ALLWA|nr:flagellar assembly peptidoglycan hydrolase FlgJ [Allochromatium warmingii]SDX55620.1 flagellar protein FlgJ [Allochromatium warmingii]